MLKQTLVFTIVFCLTAGCQSSNDSSQVSDDSAATPSSDSGERSDSSVPITRPMVDAPVGGDTSASASLDSAIGGTSASSPGMSSQDMSASTADNVMGGRMSDSVSDETTPNEPDEPQETDVQPMLTGEFSKSLKRGIAYNMVHNEDFEALERGVSWWYNWYFKSDASMVQATSSEMVFIPMLWGRNPESDYDELERWLLAHPEIQHVLVLNEPNLVDQANMMPSDAVAEWVRYEAFQDRMREMHDREILLVGPAITWGTLPGYEDPIVWMDGFISEFRQTEGRDPRFDVLAFHWYDYGLDEQLTRLEKYGKTFWVTEMANWHREQGWTIDTPEKQKDTMIDMVRICESRDDVERYAWFMGRWDPDPHFTSIFEDEPGVLTPLGESYIIQPW